jgi:hypothetical protein
VGGQPGVAVVEPDHGEATIGQGLAEVVGPVEHVHADAGDQQ